MVATQNLAPQVVGTPKDTPQSPLCPTSVWSIGSEGASWELGKGPLAQQKWWASQNLAPQVVGTPKHTPQSPLDPTSAYSIGSGGSKLGVRGGTLGPTEVVGTPKLGPTGGGHPKTYPWEPLAALGLQSDSGALLPHPLSPLTPSASLGPWDLPRASGSLGSLWQPWVFSQTQGPCSPTPLLPLTSLSPSWGLRKPWEPLAVLGLQSDSGALLPPCSPSPLSLPGASGSLQKPLATLGLQSDSGTLLLLLPAPPLLPLTPLTPEPP